MVLVEENIVPMRSTSYLPNLMAPEFFLRFMLSLPDVCSSFDVIAPLFDVMPSHNLGEGAFSPLEKRMFEA